MPVQPSWDGPLLAVVAEFFPHGTFEKWDDTRDFREHAVGRGVGLRDAHAVHDADTIWPSVFVPASGGMPSFTRSTRRSPFVNVPLFSKNDAPGSTTFDVRELRGLRHGMRGESPLLAADEIWHLEWQVC